MNNEGEASNREMYRSGVMTSVPFITFFLLGGLAKIGSETGMWLPVSVLLTLFGGGLAVLYWSNWRRKEWALPLGIILYPCGFVVQAALYGWYLIGGIAEPVFGFKYLGMVLYVVSFVLVLVIVYLGPFLLATQTWRGR